MRFVGNVIVRIVPTFQNFRPQNPVKMPPAKSHIPPSSGRLPPIFPGFTKPESTDKYPPLHEQFVHFLRASFLDQVGDPAERQATEETERLREKCRAGNPFPLIAHQWPFLVIPPESPDHAIFRDNLQQVSEHPIIDELKSVILDGTNPTLRLDWWQHLALAGAFNKRIGEVYLAGGTGVGKGACSCLAVNLWYDVFDQAKIHLTGTNWDRCNAQVYAEVKKWMEGKSKDVSAPKNDNHFIRILNPDLSDKGADKKFSGAHGPATFFLFDEANIHPDLWVENARRPALKIFALANPRAMLGWFWRAFETMKDGVVVETIPGPMRLMLRMRIGGLHCLNIRYHRLKIPVAPKGGLKIDPAFHK